METGSRLRRSAIVASVAVCLAALLQGTAAPGPVSAQSPTGCPVKQGPVGARFADWERITFRILRQNALRALIPTTPDWQTC